MKHLLLIIVILVQACVSRGYLVMQRPTHNAEQFESIVKVGSTVKVAYHIETKAREEEFVVGCKEVDGFGKTCEEKIFYENIDKLSVEKTFIGGDVYVPLL